MSYEPPPHGFRTFLIVWVTQSISVFGSALTLFAINIWLTQSLYPLPEQKPQLAMSLSIVNLAFAIPVVFGAPLAGAWVDRHDRKKTMMAMDFVSGLLSLTLMFLMVSGVLELWTLAVLTALFSFVAAFHNAAFDTSYAMIVPENLLPRANGMMQTIWALSGIVSPMIAAAIIALPALARQGNVPGPLGDRLASFPNGVPLTFAIDAVTFFIAAATLIFLYIPSPKASDSPVAGKNKPGVWADIKLGGMYIWQRRPLLWLLATFTVANFVGGPMGVFQPLLIKFNLAPNWQSLGYQYETALALLASIGAVGGFIGGLVITIWGGLKSRRVYAVLVALIIDGLAMMVLGWSNMLYLSAAMVFIAAAMIPFMNSHSQTIWQTQTPRELQGRVFSVRRVIAQFTWPLSTVFAGLVGGLFNPGTVITVLGSILVVFCILQFFNPYLLRVEDKAYLDGLAENRLTD